MEFPPVQPMQWADNQSALELKAKFPEPVPEAWSWRVVDIADPPGVP
jgi:hypothetical protein